VEKTRKSQRNQRADEDRLRSRKTPPKNGSKKRSRMAWEKPERRRNSRVVS